MDNTTNQLDNLDNVNVDANPTPVTTELDVLKAQLEEQRQETGKLKRLLNKQEKQALDPDIAKSIEEITTFHRTTKFANEYGITPSQAEQLFAIKPNPTKEDMENPLLKGALQQLQRESRVTNNTPGASYRAQPVSNFSSMSREERIKSFENLGLGNRQ